MPQLVIKEEYQTSVVGSVVTASVTIFRDKLSNVLARICTFENLSTGVQADQYGTKIWIDLQ